LSFSIVDNRVWFRNYQVNWKKGWFFGGVHLF
jgi:hypothetical protein